jgi:hypothetical protein
VACTADTNSIDLTEAGGILSADLRLDPNPANAASVSANGLLVAGANETGWFSTTETWTYASADAPTFAFTVPGDKTAKYYKGMRMQLTQAAAVKYFIVTGVSYDSGTNTTTVTVYGGTDYTLTSAAISAPSYSTAKAPAGFDPTPTKWMVSTTDSTDRTQASPAQNTWYNLGAVSLTIPLGAWYVEWRASVNITRTGGGTAKASLSTANNAESDPELTAGYKNASDGGGGTTTGKTKPLALLAKTIYYMVISTTNAATTSLQQENATQARLVIRAVSAYL